MGETFEIQSFKDGFSHWLYETTPFLPTFERIDDYSYDVKLNQAYIHNWADGAKQIKISMGNWQIGFQETQTYYLKVGINDQLGTIHNPSIVNTAGSANDGYVNLQAASELSEGPNPSEAEIKYVWIPALQITGPSIDEIYLRENIHIWLRGFNQKGSYRNRVEDIGVLIPEETADANNYINFRAIGIKDAEDNILTMNLVEDTIELYVPDPTSSEPT